MISMPVVLDFSKPGCFVDMSETVHCASSKGRNIKKVSVFCHPLASFSFFFLSLLCAFQANRGCIENC